VRVFGKGATANPNNASARQSLTRNGFGLGEGRNVASLSGARNPNSYFKESACAASTFSIDL
jgi:hypothetical protein